MTSEDGSLIQERFTVERWQDQVFILIEGEQSSLEGALRRLLGYHDRSIEGVAQRFTINDVAPLMRFGIVAMVLIIVAAGWALAYWQ